MVDCKKIKGAGSPGRVSLCELAMKMDTAPLIDAHGFAYVSQYEQPGDDGPDEGHLAVRVCGAKASERMKRLYGEIRFQLSQEPTSGRSRVACSGLQCELTGEGEWSTNSTLYFRRVNGELKLEAWTQIEVTLVDPKVVAQRQAFLQKSRAALAKAPCSP